MDRESDRLGRHWIRDVLQEAAGTGPALPDSLRDDLRRVAEIVESAQPYAFRSRELERLADVIDEIADIDELSKLAWEIAVAAGFHHCTLFVLRQGESAAFRHRICTSYPEAWIQRFRARNYQFVDPIVARAAEAAAPFHFRDAHGDGPIAEAFWQDAERHGIGRHGLCVPIELPCGARIGVSFSCACSEEVALRLARRHMSDLQVIAHQLVEAFGYLSRITPRAADTLTPVELRFLHMLVTGADPQEALRMTAHSGSPAAIKGAIQRKLGVSSVFQAVALASARGWFDDMPYEPSEVARAVDDMTAGPLLVAGEDEA